MPSLLPALRVAAKSSLHIESRSGACTSAIDWAPNAATSRLKPVLYVRLLAGGATARTCSRNCAWWVRSTPAILQERKYAQAVQLPASEHREEEFLSWSGHDCARVAPTKEPQVLTTAPNEGSRPKEGARIGPGSSSCTSRRPRHRRPARPHVVRLHHLTRCDPDQPNRDPIS